MSGTAMKVLQEKSNKLQGILGALNSKFRERKELNIAMMVGLLSKKNVFVLGPPGTAKSAGADALCKAVTGSRYFQHLMGKLTTADEIFGSPDIGALKAGRFQRNTDNMLPDAHIAFLDEVFKSSSAVLNTTLSLMNERTFNNGGKMVACPLQLVVGASNEIPESEELGALYDRFTIRVAVDYIQKDASMADLLVNGIDNVPMPTMTLDELEAEQEAAASLVISKEVVDAILELRALCRKEGIQVSDRKWVQAMSVVRAYAYLNGRTQVETEDLEVLENVLWDRPEQRKAVRSLVSKVSNPIGEKVMKITDAVQSVFAELKKDRNKIGDASNKIKGAVRQLEELHKKYQNNAKVKQALEESKAIQKEILQEFIGWTGA